MTALLKKPTKSSDRVVQVHNTFMELKKRKFLSLQQKLVINEKAGIFPISNLGKYKIQVFRQGIFTFLSSYSNKIDT